MIFFVTWNNLFSETLKILFDFISITHANLIIWAVHPVLLSAVRDKLTVICVACVHLQHLYKAGTLVKKAHQRLSQLVCLRACTLRGSLRLHQQTLISLLFHVFARFL